MLKRYMYDDIIETIKQLKEEDYTILAAEITKSSIPLAEVHIPKKWVLIMGHDGYGISTEVLSLCDKVIHIEMVSNVKSFNVYISRKS